MNLCVWRTAETGCAERVALATEFGAQGTELGSTLNSTDQAGKHGFNQ